MTLIEAARLALGELSKIAVAMPYPVGRSAITALRTAIAEAEKQEPVAWNLGVPPLYPEIKDGETISVEYVEATPPAAYPEFECPRCGHCCAQRQPLTDEEIDDIWNWYCDEMGEASINDAYDIARAIEAAHGITGEKT
jgi:hypothetical protein